MRGYCAQVLSQMIVSAKQLSYSSPSSRKAIIITIISVLLLLQGQVAQGSIQPVHAGPQQPFNLKGDTLVLDVGSLSYQGNHPIGPPIGAASTCAEYCDKTADCTGWTYCNKKEGCGSGCDAYVKGNPRLTTVEGQNPTMPSKSWYSLKTIKGFGPWGSTAGCVSNCAWSPDGKEYVCNATGKWPFGMCSLKKAAKAEYWSQDDGEGWVSGYVQLPRDCSGLSARACRRCLSSKNPAACISCAKAPETQPSLMESVTSGYYTMHAPDGCGACYNSSAADKCTACLHQKQACAACALQPENPSNPGQQMDVLSCIDCTNTYGSLYSKACVSCGLLGASASNVQKCMGCIKRASHVACNSTDWPSGCWNPETQSSGCSTCVTMATDYETCVKCIEKKPYTESCTTCAFMPDVAKQAGCYACARASNSPYSACTDCFSYLTDEKALNQCVACITSSRTTADGKQWCWGCQNWCTTYESRDKCGQCLATKHDNYVQACSCNSK